MASDRSGSYRVQVEGLSTYVDTQKGRQELLTDWRYVRVLDVNGVVMHTAYCRASDAPAEVGLAVERAMRLAHESQGIFAPMDRA